jgi:energy-converting hydrogenase Eha subunit B
MKTALGLIMLVLLAALMPLPSAEAAVTGPLVVNAGSSFQITVSGSQSSAYCAYVIVNVPSGFSASPTRFNVGSSFSKTITAWAPNYKTSGTFSATLFYWKNSACSGTSYVTTLGWLTVSVIVPTKYAVTFVVLATFGQMKNAYVSVYDSKGNYVGTWGNAAACSTCPVYVKASLPAGSYKASALGLVALPGQMTQKQCMGVIWITVSGPSSFTIPLWPLP